MKRSLSFHRQSGFTLLEVLLVAMLMGLVATAVTLSMGGARGDRELDKQARRFMATLQQAQEYSVMDGRLLGLRVEENGWQFMSRDPKDRKWRALTGDRLLGPVTLPEGMTLAVELEGRHSRGATLVDWQRRTGRPANARIVMEYDQARFEALIRAALGA